MCGIGITRFKNMKNVFKEQEDRGLHTLGVINLKYKSINKSVRETLLEYDEVIDNYEHRDGLCIMHHRKASIGALSLDNAHPFTTPKFTLMQNGTSRKFMKEFGDTYKKETDSETLLAYLDARCDSLPQVIDELDSFTDTLGIIIMVDIKTSEVLIYSDGARESWIEIQNGLLKQYLNYEPEKFEGFKNEGYLIIDFNGKIHDKFFKEKVNTTLFTPVKKSYSYTPNTYSYNDNRNWNNGYGSYRESYTGNRLDHAAKGTQGKLPVGETKKSELFDSGLLNTTVKALQDGGVDTYVAFFDMTEFDLICMPDMTQFMIKEIKMLLKTWSMNLPQGEDDMLNDEFNETMHAGFDPLEAEYMNKLHEEIPFDLEEGEYFYSEEILGDETLLYNDILCYIYRTRKNATLKGYAYQNMGIPETRAIKRVVGKSKYRQMKRMFKAASEKSLLNN